MLNTMTLKPAPAAAGHWATEPYVGLATNQHMSAPISAAQGTAVSTFGRTSGRTRALIDLDVTAANPGSPPREAPV
ncbi:MAG: hypothetical protein JWP11_341 [Frankiales bacterium]|nr:hypothetical protein [Frankiales bacterium]